VEAHAIKYHGFKLNAVELVNPMGPSDNKSTLQSVTVNQSQGNGRIGKVVRNSGHASVNFIFPTMQLLWLLLLPLGTFANDFLHHSLNDTQSLLWGPYRPNLYFGLRPRLPKSLMTGLIWFGTQNYQSIGRQYFSSPNNLQTDQGICCTEARHACDQGDGLDSYTWTEYDAREGGIQVLKDSKNNVEITTEFLKIAGGDHGGSWAVRIKGTPINPGNFAMLVEWHIDLLRC
jgi:Glycosyl hydrolase family 63 N-terminal domain